MPTTPKLGLPYPPLSNVPNVPADIQALAQGVDALGILGGKCRTSTSGIITTTETIVVDTQTLALPANSVFEIDFYCCFNTSVAGSDITMRVRMSSVTGTALGETAAEGVYASAPNYGHLIIIYKTTVAELDYFCGTIVAQGTGVGNLTAIVPTSLIVTNLGPSTVVGNY